MEWNIYIFFVNHVPIGPSFYTYTHTVMRIVSYSMIYVLTVASGTYCTFHSCICTFHTTVITASSRQMQNVAWMCQVCKTDIVCVCVCVCVCVSLSLSLSAGLCLTMRGRRIVVCPVRGSVSDMETSSMSSMHLMMSGGRPGEWRLKETVRRWASSPAKGGELVTSTNKDWTCDQCRFVTTLCSHLTLCNLITTNRIQPYIFNKSCQ